MTIYSALKLPRIIQNLKTVVQLRQVRTNSLPVEVISRISFAELHKKNVSPKLHRDFPRTPNMPSTSQSS